MRKLGQLIRLDDNFIVNFYDLKFLEFDKNNSGLKLHDKPKIGYSCICDLNTFSFNWQTTEIKEIISETEFKTLNSHYKIIK